MRDNAESLLHRYVNGGSQVKLVATKLPNTKKSRRVNRNYKERLPYEAELKTGKAAFYHGNYLALYNRDAGI